MDHQNIQQRRQQPNIAFRKMMALWFCRHHASKPMRIRLCSLCPPYPDLQIGMWGLTKSKLIVWTLSTRNNCTFFLVSFILITSPTRHSMNAHTLNQCIDGSPCTMEDLWTHNLYENSTNCTSKQGPHDSLYQPT